MEEFGGYDYEFVENISDRYKCTVCTRVLRDPELTVCCGQHFCGTCLLQWFKSQHNKSCPHCRAEGSKFQHVENKSLKSEIHQLRIACLNKGLGCQWTGEVGNLSDHLKGESGCSYAETQCPNKCGVKVIRSRLTDHMSNDCKLRKESCQYCNKEDTFTAISEHKKICPKFPLICPNGCCFDTIHREKMPDHLEVCPLKKLVCPFEEAGCTARVKPEELDKHMEKSLMDHLRLLANNNKKMRSELQKMSSKVEQTEKDFQTMKAEQEKEKECIKRMKKSLMFEVKALDEGKVGDMQSAAYESIQTQLEEERNILEKKDTTVFRMLNFSEHVKDSTTWYSPPFKIQQYKLCLAVHPRGLGSGFGSHASLSLILKEVGSSASTGGPTLSSVLSSIHVLVPLFKLGSGKLHRVFLSGVCGSSINLSPMGEGEEKRILGTREEWLNHGIISNELWNDSLIIKIERAGPDFSDMHAAMFARAAHAMSPGGAECRQS